MSQAQTDGIINTAETIGEVVAGVAFPAALPAIRAAAAVAQAIADHASGTKPVTDQELLDLSAQLQTSLAEADRLAAMPDPTAAATAQSTAVTDAQSAD